MPLRLLSEKDFVVKDGCLMITNDQGICVVMFKADKCQGSAVLVPVFEELERAEKRVQFSIMSIVNARRLISSSQSTSTPLKVTPTIILYANGKPKAVYKGNKDRQSILQFIGTMVQRIGVPDTQFVKTQDMINPQEPQIKRVYLVDKNLISHFREAPVAISFNALKNQKDEDASFGLPDEIPYNAPWQIID